MTTRTLLRGAAGATSVALLVLWAFTLRFLLGEGSGPPAPAMLIFPVLFAGLTLWALVAALRDEPVYLLLAGGLSFVPIGLFLLFMPGFVRWIGVLNLGVAGVGIILLRMEGGERPPDEVD